MPKYTIRPYEVTAIEFLGTVESAQEIIDTFGLKNTQLSAHPNEITGQLEPKLWWTPPMGTSHSLLKGDFMVLENKTPFSMKAEAFHQSYFLTP